MTFTLTFPAWISLPVDVLARIFELLDEKSQHAFVRVCETFNALKVRLACDFELSSVKALHHLLSRGNRGAGCGKMAYLHHLRRQPGQLAKVAAIPAGCGPTSCASL